MEKKPSLWLTVRDPLCVMGGSAITFGLAAWAASSFGEDSAAWPVASGMGTVAIVAFFRSSWLLLTRLRQRRSADKARRLTSVLLD